jgi:hypothetical protein
METLLNRPLVLHSLVAVSLVFAFWIFSRAVRWILM